MVLFEGGLEKLCLDSCTAFKYLDLLALIRIDLKQLKFAHQKHLRIFSHLGEILSLLLAFNQIPKHFVDLFAMFD